MNENQNIMFTKAFLSLFLLIIFSFATFYLTGCPVPSSSDQQSPSQSDDTSYAGPKFAWIFKFATYGSERADPSENEKLSYREHIDEMIQWLEGNCFDEIIVSVRQDHPGDGDLPIGVLWYGSHDSKYFDCSDKKYSGELLCTDPLPFDELLQRVENKNIDVWAWFPVFYDNTRAANNCDPNLLFPEIDCSIKDYVSELLDDFLSNYSSRISGVIIDHIRTSGFVLPLLQDTESDKVAQFTRALADIVHSYGLPIGAFVKSPQDSQEHGQDYQKMINQGDLDFVSPMVYWDDYGVSPTQAGNWVEEMVSSLGGDNVIPCIPGRGSACAGASYSEQQEFFSKIEGIVDSYTMYVHRYEDGKNEEGSNCFYDPQDIYIGKTSEIYKHPCSSSGAGDPCDHLCEIGDTRCESGELTRCIPNNDDCRVWGAGMTCASGACLDATQCLVCESGASYSCGADGNVWSYDSCGNPESISQTCGSSGYEGSNYCSNGDVYKDYVERGCTNASCYANSTPELIATCGAGGCSNGTCVGCTPSAYTACYDDDVYYYDSCDVLGDKALECGVSSYSGDDYCLGGNVVRDYVTRYCDSASCKEDMTQELQQDCQGAGCSNGACHPVCDPQDHLGCYNDDVFWYDSCGNRESKFEECGLSSWIGDPYCKNNDLYQEYTERGCSSASCYENTYEQLKEDCGGAGCDDGSSESLDQQQTSFGDPYSFYYDGHKIAKQSFVPTGDEVTKVELKLMVYYYSYADPCKWPHSDYETIDVDITTNSGSIIADNDDYPICGMPTEAGSNIGMRVEIPFTSVYDQFNSGETYWIKIKYNGDRLSTDVEAPIQWDRATYDAYPNGESWASGESETDDFWFKLYTKSTTPQCN